MRKTVLILALSAPLSAYSTSALAQTECPPVPDRDPSYSELMENVRTAPNEATAQALSNQLWEIWATAPNDRAQTLLDQGMKARASYAFDTAIESFDELVGYCPHYAEGYNQRAFVNFIRADYATALDDLDRALELDPAHIAALSGRALALMGLGRTEAGQSQLRAALEFNPWLPERSMLIEVPGDDI